MKQEVIPVLDCGVTNVKAITANWQEEVVAHASIPSTNDIVVGNNTWYQWPLGVILQRLVDCCR